MSDRPRLSTRALCEVEDVKDLLGIEDDDTASDRAIVRAINAVSVEVLTRSQREFLKTENDTRFTRIDVTDILLDQIRIGDVRVITAMSLLTPDRDQEYALTAGDWLLLPDDPELGHPFDRVKIKSTAPYQPVDRWWLKTVGNWGFSEIPDNIIQTVIGSAANWVLNDVMKLSAATERQGRSSPPSLIAREYDETVEGFRIYRVA